MVWLRCSWTWALYRRAYSPSSPGMVREQKGMVSAAEQNQDEGWCSSPVWDSLTSVSCCPCHGQCPEQIPYAAGWLGAWLTGRYTSFNHLCVSKKGGLVSGCHDRWSHFSAVLVHLPSPSSCLYEPELPGVIQLPDKCIGALLTVVGGTVRTTTKKPNIIELCLHNIFCIFLLLLNVAELTLMAYLRKP